MQCYETQDNCLAKTKKYNNKKLFRSNSFPAEVQFFVCIIYVHYENESELDNMYLQNICITNI